MIEAVNSFHEKAGMSQEGFSLSVLPESKTRRRKDMGGPSRD
jgi:hypothetical protein